MRLIDKETLTRLRQIYPVGSQVVLEKMDDAQAPPVGAIGTVQTIDDLASIHVLWDTGARLGIVYGVDQCRRCEDRSELG